MEPGFSALNRYTTMKFGTRWPPVPAGILIGISMLLAFVVAGRGIGASGAMTRFVAWVQHGLFPAATEQSAYFGNAAPVVTPSPVTVTAFVFCCVMPQNALARRPRISASKSSMRP